MKIGLPLLCLTVGGSIALSYFVQGKYEIQDARKTVKDISSTTGTSPIKDIDLEVELQRLHSSVDLNSYENKPVPRPPEDS